MKVMLLIGFALIANSVVAQQHTYIRIYTIQAGMEDKDKVKFFYPDHADSAAMFNKFKLPVILMGVEFLEQRGFELVSITPATTNVGIAAVILTVAVMRRLKR